VYDLQNLSASAWARSRRQGSRGSADDLRDGFIISPAPRKWTETERRHFFRKPGCFDRGRCRCARRGAALGAVARRSNCFRTPLWRNSILGEVNAVLDLRARSDGSLTSGVEPSSAPSIPFRCRCAMVSSEGAQRLAIQGPASAAPDTARAGRYDSQARGARFGWDFPQPHRHGWGSTRTLVPDAVLRLGLGHLSKSARDAEPQTGKSSPRVFRLWSADEAIIQTGWAQQSRRRNGC